MVTEYGQRAVSTKGTHVKVIFDLENNAVAVRCNYRFQLEEAICRFDPFQLQPTRMALGRA